MAIYDCFQYFNEDHMVDLNILNDHVDWFVISESTKTHQGNNKKLNFNINNFSKFKHKIIYIIANFDKNIELKNHTGGESVIEQHQRNNILNGLRKANENDLIILSDSDEIPDLTKLSQINKKISPVADSEIEKFLSGQNLNISATTLSDFLNSASSFIGSKTLSSTITSSVPVYVPSSSTFSSVGTRTETCPLEKPVAGNTSV